MYSLSARLLLTMSLLLVVFFGATIFLLDLVFRDSAEDAIRDRLDVQIVVLLAGAESPDGATLLVPELPEARFLTPGSGLYGQVDRPNGSRVWRSPSAVGDGLDSVPAMSPGLTAFNRTRLSAGDEVFALSLGVEWEFDDGSSAPFVFTAAESLAPYHAQVGRFRGQLFGWFALLTVALLSGQLLLIRAMLKPLRQVEREIVEVEDGARAQLSAAYPRELEGVTANLNVLIQGERDRLARYRDTLGNLAHSLKTPLAVMRTVLERDSSSGEARSLTEQVDRMQDIVGYQLQRAAAWGATTLGQAGVDVAPVATQVLDSLAKVYADKSPQCERDIDAAATFYGEEGDLMEVLGNLLDNAFKYCAGSVRIEIASIAGDGRRREGLRIIVDDDGPGIAADDARRVTERGVRADERAAGHGIGLSIVRDILTLHGGELRIGTSPLGGARVEAVISSR